MIQQANFLPIVNERVVVPDQERSLGIDVSLPVDDALTAIPGSRITRILNHDDPRYFELPAFESGLGYPEDFYAILRTAAT